MAPHSTFQTVDDSLPRHATKSPCERSFTEPEISSGQNTDLRDTDKLEPIAVIGFSFKFPGGATSAEAFWDMLMEQRCVSTDFPDDRISLPGIYHPDANRQDTVCLHSYDTCSQAYDY